MVYQAWYLSWDRHTTKYSQVIPGLALFPFISSSCGIWKAWCSTSINQTQGKCTCASAAAAPAPVSQQLRRQGRCRMPHVCTGDQKMLILLKTSVHVLMESAWTRLSPSLRNPVLYHRTQTDSLLKVPSGGKVTHLPGVSKAPSERGLPNCPPMCTNSHSFWTWCSVFHFMENRTLGLPQSWAVRSCWCTALLWGHDITASFEAPCSKSPVV